MGFFDSLTELFEAAAPWTTVEAEAVRGGQGTDSTPAAPGGGEGEAVDPSGPTPDKRATSADEDEDSAGGDDQEEEEEEEDEEIEDPKEKFEEECKESKQCAPAKHHFDECVERVTSAEEQSGPKEDCVEEFFHLAHCANNCAAPKLWSVLK
ncbi:MAG: hypothetical protein M1818_001703 [Claussenomyces sp. TS43310]|nr:MAG: hypothetical protein M1818_001703 [Claussenomyces sp. TS43310]